jgi:hypothetical protein
MTSRMTKWIWAGIAVAAIVAMAVWQRGATKTAYVNGLPQYNKLPLQEYIFERDCYIFKFQQKNTTYPLVGANAPDLAVSVPELPKEVVDSNIGMNDDKVRILDVVRSGARFKIISVRREQSPKETTITFEILFMDEAERKYPRLDAFYIMDHTPEKKGEAPSIIPGYAVQRVKY